MRREEDDNEMSEHLSPAERELESALGALKIATLATIDRDRLLFDAGAASARGSVRIWRAAAAVLVGALGVSIVARSGETRIVHDVVYVNSETKPALSQNASSIDPSARLASLPDGSERITSRDAALLLASPDGSNYLVLRDRALRWGVDTAILETPPVARSNSRSRGENVLDRPARRERPAPAKPSLKSLFLPGEQS